MKLSFFLSFVVGLQAVQTCFAQSTFPPEPIGLTEVISERWPGASISYKKVR
jgi:hypothetical protein